MAVAQIICVLGSSGAGTVAQSAKWPAPSLRKMRMEPASGSTRSGAPSPSRSPKETVRHCVERPASPAAAVSSSHVSATAGATTMPPAPPPPAAAPAVPALLLLDPPVAVLPVAREPPVPAGEEDEDDVPAAPPQATRTGPTTHATRATAPRNHAPRRRSRCALPILPKLS
jgi:hypothetical protein